MDQGKKTAIIVAFALGIVLITVVSALYGAVKSGVALDAARFGHPAFWICGLAFSTLLALGVWKGKSAQ